MFSLLFRYTRTHERSGFGLCDWKGCLKSERLLFIYIINSILFRINLTLKLLSKLQLVQEKTTVKQTKREKSSTEIVLKYIWKISHFFSK